MIAPQYDNTATYSVGDYCIYNSGLYKCKSEISTPESFTSSHWNQIQITNGMADTTLTVSGAAADAKVTGDELGDLKSALENTSDGSLGNKWMVFKLGAYKSPTTTGIGETIAYEAWDTQVCAICPCAVGDVFTLKLGGPSGVSRAWFVCDSNMKALARANSSISLDGEEVAITQTGAAYFCCNNKLATLSSGYYAFKGSSIKSFVNSVNRFVDYKALTIADDANDLEKSGWYNWPTTSIPAHVPYSSSSIAGKLLNLYKSSTSITQFYIPVTSSGSVNCQYRSKTSSGWSDWLVIANGNNLAALESKLDGILLLNASATGIPARITAALAGSATCETTSTTVIRYRENMMTIAGSFSNSIVTKDETGAFILSGSPSSNSYIDIQTGIKLKKGVTYRVDGSPQTADNCALCLYIGGSRYAYEPTGVGATFTPSDDVIADLKLRVMGGSTYSNVKFYPVVCEESTVQKGSPAALTLLEGNNEVVGLSFDSLTVTYIKSKVRVLEDEVAIITSAFSLDDIAEQKDESGYFSSSFSVVMKQPFRNNGKIVGINSKHISGDANATVTLSLESSGGSAVYTSRAYEIGGSIEPVTQEFKLPPFVSGYDYIRVAFTIPEGTSVAINDFYSCDATQSRHNDGVGIKWHAHTGFPGMMPGNSIPSFQMAGRLGFSSCITIPKFTSDGVGICFHDDSSISSDLCWMDGTAISGSDDVAISNYSYEYITENFRLKSTSFGILHVPTIDEYFKVCSLYNMAPIFSVHSSNLGMTYANGFAYIKALAEKWNLLDKMWIKSGSADVQGVATSVFGTDIAGRIMLRGQTSTWDPLAQAKSAGLVPSASTSAKDGICPLVFELFQTAATDEAIALGLSEGFKVSVAVVSGGLTGAAMKAFISKGVTEFTDDYHCSLGLDWINT